MDEVKYIKKLIFNKNNKTFFKCIRFQADLKCLLNTGAKLYPFVKLYMHMDAVAYE